MLLPIGLFILVVTEVVSTSRIDLGAGNFFKTVCVPSHPSSLSGHSDYVCTLKERDFYPESIGKAVQGLQLMAKADMVKDLQKTLAKNLLKLKREGPEEEFKAYKTELGDEEEFESLVRNLIQGGWPTETFDYGFELFEEFEMESRVIINKATPPKLIERLAKRKPELTVKLFHLLTPKEKISAVLNDPSSIVFNEFFDIIKARNSNLNSVFNEFAPHLCQKSLKQQPFSMIVKYFEANKDDDINEADEANHDSRANILKAINEICYGSDENLGFKEYKNIQMRKDKFVIDAALNSNNYKTTLKVLQYENRTEILNVLNLFLSSEQEIVLTLLKETNRRNFDEIDRNELLKIIIENGLESNYLESGEIIKKAIKNLQTPIQSNLHLKGLGKVFINPKIKTLILENSKILKFKFTSLSLAALIKDDHLSSFIQEFGGEQEFLNLFQFDNPEILLIYLNRPEDFHSAYKLFNLKSGDKLYESDFLVESISSALKLFHKSDDGASQMFLIIRRPQIEYLISKFNSDLFPILPANFVKTLIKSQEL